MGFSKIISIALALLVSPASIAAPADNNGATQAARRALHAILSEDATGFVAMTSPSGVAFGTDGPRISKLRLSRDFAQKHASFCAIFMCKRGAGLAPLVRELDLDRPQVHAATGAGYTVTFFSRNSAHSGVGDLTIDLEKVGPHLLVSALEYI